MFTVKADNRDEAISKLNAYLELHSPVPFQGNEDKSVYCIDRQTDV